MLYCTVERGGGVVWRGAEVATLVLAVALAVTLTFLIALLALFVYDRRGPLVVYSADPSSSWLSYEFIDAPVLFTIHEVSIL